MPDDCANSVGRLAEGLALRAYRLRALRVIHRSLGERALLDGLKVLGIAVFKL